MALPTLDTERLRLDPVREERLWALHRLWTDVDVRRYLWDDEIIALEVAATVIAESIRSAGTEGLGMWTLHRKPDSSSLIGFVALRHPRDSAEVEILYGLSPDQWGQGLATEASLAALRYAFEVLGLPRVLAGADPPNTRSMSVMARLGMTPLEGGVPTVPNATYFVIERAASRTTQG